MDDVERSQGMGQERDSTQNGYAVTQGFRPEEIDFSKLSMEQLLALKNAVVARAETRLSPTDFNPVMMTSAMLAGEGLENGAIVAPQMGQPAAEIVHEVKTLKTTVDLGVRRLTLGLVTAGTMIAASQMYSTWGFIPFVVGGASAVWFVLEMIRGTAA